MLNINAVTSHFDSASLICIAGTGVDDISFVIAILKIIKNKTYKK